jgi:uncharacterized protein
MRVVLDTNIFISALISESGPPYRAFDAWLGGRFVLYSSEQQIAELRRISRYPKLRQLVPKHVFGDLINALGKTALIEPASVAVELSDPDDAFLLGMAKTGGADYLVTGDKRAGLLALKTFGRTKIVTPTEFIAAIGG